jgi:hypothetical protein
MYPVGEDTVPTDSPGLYNYVINDAGWCNGINP